MELQVELKCNDTHLWCPSRQCVAKEAYCDGAGNCTNGYDERSVYCPGKYIILIGVIYCVEGSALALLTGKPLQIDGKVFTDDQAVEWDPQYKNESSDDYKKLALDLCHVVDQAVRLMEKIFSVPNACHLVELYKGSVFASIYVHMDKENLRSANVRYGMEEFYDLVRSTISHFPTQQTKYRFREEVTIASELR
ncbi:hypothetical protein AHF37_11414 [Paragonimus kellicotti]|nr:hypothetical protein AHF37_11414 [Paragonimus kellicotti]